MTTIGTTLDAFGEWVIIEQLGHRRLAGWLTEQTIAGHGYLRLDVPAVDGQPATSHLLAHSSIYAIHPVGKDVAAAVAEQCRPTPVQRWELPAAQPTTSALERDLSRLADRLEDADVHCDHAPLAPPEPGCAGCIARSISALAAKHIAGDDEPETAVSVPVADYDGRDDCRELFDDPDYGKDLDDEDDHDGRPF